MLTRHTLMHYLDELLQPQLFRDYCPNGLQVQGQENIQKIVCGVTANQALIETAIEQKAQAILVHHGYFWKGENPCVTGMKQQRLKSLLAHDINLIAYHLPLDTHKVYGNNQQLAQHLGLSVTGEIKTDSGPALVLQGELEQTIDADTFAQLLTNKLGQKPIYFGNNKRQIKRIAWCTGAAQDFIDNVAETDVDAYLSGEVSERTYHSAIEQGLHYFSAGHHATERYGVKALGQHLAEKFDITVNFVDIANPI